MGRDALRTMHCALPRAALVPARAAAARAAAARPARPCASRAVLVHPPRLVCRAARARCCTTAHHLLICVASALNHLPSPTPRQVPGRQEPDAVPGAARRLPLRPHPLGCAAGAGQPATLCTAPAPAPLPLGPLGRRGVGGGRGVMGGGSGFLCVWPANQHNKPALRSASACPTIGMARALHRTWSGPRTPAQWRAAPPCCLLICTRTRLHGVQTSEHRRRPCKGRANLVAKASPASRSRARATCRGLACPHSHRLHRV